MMLNPHTAVIGTVGSVASGMAWVRPIAAHEDGLWRSASADEFHPDGTVFWPQPPSELEENSVVAFRITRGSEKHEWIVEQQLDAHPVIDCSTSTYSELFRIWHSQPLSVRLPENATEAYFSFSDGLTLGPVKGKMTGQGFELDLDQGLDRIEASRGTSSLVSLGENNDWSVPLHRNLGGFRIDCRSDTEVLRSALSDTAKALKQAGTEVPDQISTRRAISDAVEILRRGALDDTKMQRLTRAQAIIANWDNGHVQASKISEEVAQLPDVAATLHGLEVKAEAAATQQALSEFERQNADAQSQLESARTEHSVLRAQAADLRSTLDQTEDIVRVRLAELSDHASSILAENVLARALTQPQHMTAPAPAPAVHRTAPVFGNPPTGCRSYGPNILSRIAAGDVVVKETLDRIHASFGAGLLPIVIGADAQLALATYARAVVAGRIASLPIAHDFLHPVDLLGIRAETGALSRPHGDLLRVANDEVSRQEPGLMVLDGFNRGATESYLAPWLTRMDRTITLTESAQTALGIASFTCSPHLLLGATAINGSTAAPVGPDLWGRAVVIDVRHWTIHAAEDISQTWVSRQTKPHPNADEIAMETRRTVVAPMEGWWHVDSSLLNAVEAYARVLAANSKDGAIDTAKIRIAVSECVLLPPITTSLGHAEVRAATEALAKWAAPKDKSLPARLERRAERIAAVLS